MNTSMITILGPTATGKTALAARVAFLTDGEVISADSRQVYRGMDIGTGKDYDDYVVEGVTIPCHLTDIADPGYEYSIFEYQRDFSQVYNDMLNRGKQPVLCGGSGMYLESVLCGYRLPGIADEPEYRAWLETLNDAALEEMLRSGKPMHNITDLEDRSRMIRALLVARQSEKEDPVNTAFSAIPSVIFGIRFQRETIMQRISRRLTERLNQGMTEEVAHLLRLGITPERLMRYGLEYRYITQHLQGTISHGEMYEQLNIAIRQFAKRQMTWFRRMERRGMPVHWLDGETGTEKMAEEVVKTCSHSAIS